MKLMNVLVVSLVLVVAGCKGGGMDLTGTYKGVPNKGSDLEGAPAMTLKLTGDHKFEITSGVKLTGSWSQAEKSVLLKTETIAGKAIPQGTPEQQLTLTVSEDGKTLTSTMQPMTWQKES